MPAVVNGSHCNQFNTLILRVVNDTEAAIFGLQIHKS